MGDEGATLSVGRLSTLVVRWNSKQGHSVGTHEILYFVATLLSFSRRLLHDVAPPAEVLN